MSFLLNVKSQMESISASHAVIGAVEFDESLSISESVSLFGRELSIMNEEINFLDNASEELLLEAVLGKHPDADILIEGVGKKFIEELKKWWGKLVAWVKGLIAKIKQRMALMTTNKNKFVERINEALKTKTSEDTSKFRWKGYKWNLSELTSEKKSVASALNVAEDAMTEMVALSNVEKVKTYAASADGLKRLQEDGKKSVEKVKKAIYSGQLGGSFEKFKEKLIKDIRGTAKADELSFSKVATKDQMVSFIEGSDDLSQVYLEAYEAAQTDIEKIIANLDKNTSTIEGWAESGNADDDQKRVDIITAYKAAAKVQKDVYNSVLADIGKVFGIQRALVDEATKDFMKILRSFASFKAPRKA